MILRFVVALPCYNNSETVERVIIDTLTQTKFPLLVIDDGSDQPVKNVLKDPRIFAAIESGRLQFIRHAANIGKGAALQAAFKWALKNNFTHVLTCDTDGQHLASQIPKIVERALECPWSLIIGSRKWQGEVPESSKFGRKFSNFWVNFETGYKALDSQSGFRVYPLFHLQNFSFFTKKYDFEIEVLIRLLWAGVDVQEVDIEVQYPKDRVTHFNKFSDNVRISLLNSVLVAVSLLRGHLDPAKSGLALGVGVLIGMTPFFGIHTLLVAIIALALRLNFLLVLIGSQVSLPIFLPFVAFFSIRVGRWVMKGGETLQRLKMPGSVHEAFRISKHFFTEWLVGSLILGVVLGAVVGGLYYFLKTWYGRKSSQPWTGKSRGGALGNGLMKQVLKYLGLRAGYFCLYFIVPYFYVFAPRARRSISQYWRAMEPEPSWLWRQKQVLKHFFVFGQSLMDRGYQAYHEKLAFEVDREGPPVFEKVKQSERGWIFLGAHVGGWELSSLFMKRDAGPARLGPVHFIGQGMVFDPSTQRNRELTEAEAAAQSGENSLIDVKTLLDEKKHVGFLADRAIGQQVELVSFLGRLAPFETRPFRIAAACRAPLIYFYSFKTGDTSYAFAASDRPDIRYAADRDRRQQIFEWTEDYVRNLESQVRRYPHQWFNFYPFWSSLPKQLPGSVPTRHENCLIEDLFHLPAGAETGPRFN